MSSTRVVVIGAGVCGLVAARRAAAAGHRVTVVEAGPEVGGQVRSGRLGDLTVDLGAEAAPLRAPGVADLVGELGLDASMIHPAPGRTLVSSRRGLVDLPAGVTPVGPTRLWPTVRSGILSPAGLLRAGLEPARARPLDHDVSVGRFVTSRFGPEVARAVVDPLLGGIHAADLDRFSLASASPAMVTSAEHGDSLVRATLARSLATTRRHVRAVGGDLARRLHALAHGDPKGSDWPGQDGGSRAGGSGTGRGPSVATWPRGLVTLPLALAEGLDVRTSTPARALTGGPGAWQVVTDGEVIDAGVVVVATPTAVAADLLAEVSPQASRLLADLRAASVATLVVEVPRPDHPIATAQTWFVGSAWSPLVRQVTNLSLKWPRTGLEPDTTVLRVALGRDWPAGRSTAPARVGGDIEGLDDQALTSAGLAELARLGLRVDPRDQVVSRWHRAMPQPAPGHRSRMAELRDLLAPSRGILVGGAGIDGAGVGTAVVAGRRLARQIG